MMNSLWEELKTNLSKHGSDYVMTKLDEARRKADGYMASHPKEDLYSVEFDRPEDDMELGYLLPLSQEELAVVKKYKELGTDDDPDEETEALFEALIDRAPFPFTDPDNPWLVKDISDKPSHSFQFTVAVLKDREKAPQLTGLGLGMKDEDYAVLLTWRLFHAYRNDAVYSFNRMRDELPSLFDFLARHLEFVVNETMIREENPYVVYMDELERNVAEIMKQE